MIKYRPDIDGLRAVAVIAVLIFHAFPDYLSGGFVGVDVFFVISGFLISKIILTELSVGNFSLFTFYQKRVRRIFPALITVLLTCILFGWVYLLSDELRMLGKHVVGGAGFISNIVLFRESGYFDVEAQFKPLLHMWSLGIEEQFYLIWPIFILIFFRKKILLPCMLFALFASFYLNITYVDLYPSSVFYLLPYRFWELAIGGILAYIELRSKNLLFFLDKSHIQNFLKRKENFITEYFPILTHLLSILGISLILYGIFMFSEKNIAFPGWAALFPTIGTALLIAAGPHAWINRNILSGKIIVFLGLISYPLYLWHWPILTFNRIIQEAPSIVSRLTCLLISLIMAWVTYHYIEKNLRYKKNIVFSLLISMGIVGCLGFSGYKSYITGRFFPTDQLIAQSKTEWGYPAPNMEINGFPVRVLGASIEPSKILFVGDSNIEQYYPRVEKVLSSKIAPPQVTFLTGGGCPPVPDLKRDSHPHCKFMNNLIDVVKTNKFTRVIIGGLWSAYLVDSDNYYFDINGKRQVND